MWWFPGRCQLASPASTSHHRVSLAASPIPYSPPPPPQLCLSVVVSSGTATPLLQNFLWRQYYFFFLFSVFICGRWNPWSRGCSRWARRVTWLTSCQERCFGPQLTSHGRTSTQQTSLSHHAGAAFRGPSNSKKPQHLLSSLRCLQVSLYKNEKKGRKNKKTWQP